MIKRAKVLHRTHNSEYPIEIANRILAERAAWKSALGVPQGFEIPRKPMPTTWEELGVELAEVTAKLEEVTAACLGDPPASQERESLTRHMLTLQERLWELLTLKKEWSDQTNRRLPFSAAWLRSD
jgi:hypothetical protein